MMKAFAAFHQFEIWHDAGGDEALKQWRPRMLSRMFSLSEFMKALKLRFTQWYNSTLSFHRTGLEIPNTLKGGHRTKPPAHGVHPLGCQR